MTAPKIEVAASGRDGRNIVVLCDGTSNQFSRDRTSVAKIAYALIKDPDRQAVYYHPGIGTKAPPGFPLPVGSLLARMAGLAFAYGLNDDVRTDINNPQIVNRRLVGVAPLQDIDTIVATLGNQSRDKAYLDAPLSSGVRLIAKPSALHVPPWQFVSSLLGGQSLLTATWWASPRIASTRSAADVHCWDPLLPILPGRVDVAVKATWENVPVSFTGGPNHAKIGVSTGDAHYAIFGDLNQQGQLGDASSPDGAACGSSQNGRGGMFFVLTEPTLQTGLAKLMSGEIAPYPQ